MAKSEFDKWRKMDPEFNEHYYASEDKEMFTIVYRRVWATWGSSRLSFTYTVTSNVPESKRAEYGINPGDKLSSKQMREAGLNTSYWMKKGWVRLGKEDGNIEYENMRNLEKS